MKNLEKNADQKCVEFDIIEIRSISIMGVCLFYFAKIENLSERK